jgi:yeast amino acid transporter
LLCYHPLLYTENELVAITEWETEYPRYSLPKAVRRVSGRIVFYYTFAVLILGLTVSSSDPLLNLTEDTNARYPGGFIIMAERAGIPAVPHIINATIILAALSVVTVDIYVTVLPILLISLISDRVDVSQQWLMQDT